MSKKFILIGSLGLGLIFMFLCGAIVYRINKLNQEQANQAIIEIDNNQAGVNQDFIQRPELVEQLNEKTELNQSAVDNLVTATSVEGAAVETVNQVAKSVKVDQLQPCIDQSSGYKPEGEVFCAVTATEFEANCLKQNGTFVSQRLHPTSIDKLFCLEKQTDAGKACSSDGQCSSAYCTFSLAIQDGTCVKHDQKNGTGSEEGWLIETYNCQTTEPGRCAEVSDNFTPKILQKFEISGTTLIRKTNNALHY